MWKAFINAVYTRTTWGTSVRQNSLRRSVIVRETTRTAPNATLYQSLNRIAVIDLVWAIELLPPYCGGGDPQRTVYLAARFTRFSLSAGKAPIVSVTPTLSRPEPHHLQRKSSDWLPNDLVREICNSLISAIFWACGRIHLP